MAPCEEEALLQDHIFRLLPSAVPQECFPHWYEDGKVPVGSYGEFCDDGEYYDRQSESKSKSASFRKKSDTRTEKDESGRVQQSVNVKKPESLATKVTDSSNSEPQTAEESDKTMEPAEVEMADNSADKKVTSEVLPELTEMSVAVQAPKDIEPTEQLVVCKQEPTYMDMELAEDFTRREPVFPTIPLVNIKQEKTASYRRVVAREQAAESHAVVQIANSSLSLLSQYISSDSESNITDSEEELPRKNPNPARRRDSSSESSDDDSIEVIPNTTNYRVQDATIVISDTETAPIEDDDYDEDLTSSDEEPENARPVKARGETLVHELPPIEELQITVPEKECKPVGHVQSVVAQIVIVQSYAGVELLNLDTVLFLDRGKRPLGKIFDVIGQVMAPMYCVLFNSRQHVVDKGISVGMPVYCAPQTEHTSFIILSDLMRHKGSDASWLDDIEPPEYMLEYSDDEQERRARRRRNSSSSTGRHTPEAGRRPYNVRGRTRGSIRGRGSGHSWHFAITPPQPRNQRVINPFAVAASTSGTPPPPPPPPASSN